MKTRILSILMALILCVSLPAVAMADETAEPADGDVKASLEGSEIEEKNDEAPTGIFDDVEPGAYYEIPIAWAVEKNITVGIGNNLFAPEATCTRAQVATFIWRAAGSPEPTSANPFSDVAEGSFFEKAAAWAAENDMASGENFSPDDLCTRAMAIEFMWGLAGRPDAEDAGFSDVAATDSYAMAVNWAFEKKLVVGIGDNQFAPEVNLTRAQVVILLHRAFAE